MYNMQLIVFRFYVGQKEEKELRVFPIDDKILNNLRI